jgi:uncharacterized protein YfdQ (DUF2303 family)
VDLTRYIDGREAAPLALVGDLAAQLAEVQATAVYEADGVCVLQSGMKIDYRDLLDRPTRRRGNVTLSDVESFTAYLGRLGTADTMVYASIEDERITAVLNDHPALDEPGGADAVAAGRRDDIAQLVLRTSEDWQTITTKSAKMWPQRQFAELIEDLAHTVVTPDSATMLEIASTLNVRQNIDFGSRVRTQSGDVEFRFEQTSDARAGRDTRVEIPTVIAFEAPVWVGSPPVRIEARLRFHASEGGCVMGYRLMRLGEVVESAFRDLIVEINGAEVAPPALFGDPMVGVISRTGR